MYLFSVDLPAENSTRSYASRLSVLKEIGNDCIMLRYISIRSPDLAYWYAAN